MKPRGLLCAAAWIFSLGTAAVAETGSNYTEFVPMQQRAQGQSLTGAALLNDSIFSNPASSAFTQVYSVDGTFLSTRSFAVSVLDTRTSALGGGIAYYRTTRPGFESVIQGGKLLLSARVSEHIGVGVSGKAVWGPDQAGESARYSDLDFGLLAHYEVVQMGVLIQNTLGGNQGMGVAREYSVGARVNWEQTMFLSASMNGAVQGFRPQQFGFGVEYVSPYYFAIKGGYRLRPVDALSFWAAGISILSPKLSVHYALEIPNQAGSALQHSVGTTFLF